MKQYKFIELQFQDHPTVPYPARQAVMNFDSGYGVSVVTGSPFFNISDIYPYELAVLKDSQLCYDSEITRDIMGYLDHNDVEEIMNRVAQL